MNYEDDRLMSVALHSAPNHWHHCIHLTQFHNATADRSIESSSQQLWVRHRQCWERLNRFPVEICVFPLPATHRNLIKLKFGTVDWIDQRDDQMCQKLFEVHSRRLQIYINYIAYTKNSPVYSLASPSFVTATTRRLTSLIQQIFARLTSKTVCALHSASDAMFSTVLLGLNFFFEPLRIGLNV